MAEQDGADTLAEELDAWEQTDDYTTQRLLKEGEFERTELVADAAGRLFVRKYLKGVSAAQHPYERICGLALPYIPKVVQAVRVGDELVVVSEHVEGTSLAELVEHGGALAQDMALGYAGCVAQALNALHTLAPEPIIHRDVSPGNVIVNERGAWLIDFGIARNHVAGAARDTQAYGTAGFAAPEQYGFAQTDERTDVYALGKLVEFMLTGEYAPQPGLYRYDKRLERVVKKATAIDAKARYASVAELQAALAGQPAPRAQRPARRAKRRAAGEGQPAAASEGGPGPAAGERAAKAAGAVGHVLFVAYKVAFTTLSVLWLLVVLCMPFLDSTLPDMLFMWVWWVFLLAVPCVTSTDLFGLVGKIGWFQAKRHQRQALVIAASLFAGVFLLIIVVSTFVA